MKMVKVGCWLLRIHYDDGDRYWICSTEHECRTITEGWAKDNWPYDGDEEDDPVWDELTTDERIDTYFNDHDYEYYDIERYEVEYRADELQNLIYKATMSGVSHG